MFKINSNKQKHLNVKKKTGLSFLHSEISSSFIKFWGSGSATLDLLKFFLLLCEFWKKLSEISFPHNAFACRRSNFLLVSISNSMQETSAKIFMLLATWVFFQGAAFYYRFQSHNCHFYGPRWGLLEGYFEQVVPYRTVISWKQGKI